MIAHHSRTRVEGQRWLQAKITVKFYAKEACFMVCYIDVLEVTAMFCVGSVLQASEVVALHNVRISVQ